MTDDDKNIDVSILIDYSVSPPKVTTSEAVWDNLRAFAPELDDSVYMSLKDRLAGLFTKAIILDRNEDMDTLREVVWEGLDIDQLDKYFASGNARSYFKMFEEMARIEVSKKIVVLTTTLSPKEAQECQQIIREYADFIRMQESEHQIKH